MDGLKAIAKLTGKTCGQLAINWVIGQPGITTALVGVKNAQQMEDNLNSVGWEPEQSHQDQIEEVFAVKL